MKNKTLIWLGKFVFGGSVIVAVLLGTVVNVYDWVIEIDIFWGKLFQICGDFLHSYPTFLFPLASIFFFLLIGLIAGTSVTVPKTEEEKPQEKGSFFFFYLCCFTLLSLLVFLFSMFFFNPFTAYFSLTHDLIQGESIIYVGIVITALFQSALMSGIIFLRKVNIWVSIILSFIWFACLSAAVLPGAILSGYVFSHSKVCEEANIVAPDIVAEGIEVEDPPAVEVPDDYEYNDGEEYEYDSPFCDGMWDNPESCTPHVESALIFADNWYHQDDASHWEFSNKPIWNNELPQEEDYGYKVWKGINGGYDGYANFHKAVNFFKKEPGYLTRFFELYEQVLYQTISKQRYEEYGASHLVPLFIAAYQDLYRNGVEDGREKSLAIYTKMSTGELGGIWDGSGHFEFITQFATQEILNKFHYARDEQIDEELVVWIYSFWARRENEGIAQAAYNILQQITNHYQQ